MSKSKEKDTCLISDCSASSKIENWTSGEWDLWVEERKTEADDVTARMYAVTSDHNLKKARAREIAGIKNALVRSSEVLRDVKSLKRGAEGVMKQDIKKLLPRVRKLVKETQDLHR